MPWTNRIYNLFLTNYQAIRFGRQTLLQNYIQVPYSDPDFNMFDINGDFQTNRKHLQLYRTKNYFTLLFYITLTTIAETMLQVAQYTTEVLFLRCFIPK